MQNEAEEEIVAWTSSRREIGKPVTNRLASDIESFFYKKSEMSKIKMTNTWNLELENAKEFKKIQEFVNESRKSLSKGLTPT